MPGLASRADVVGTFAIVAATLVLVAVAPIHRRLAAHPTAEACADLIDRWAEHVARQSDPAIAAGAIAERRALARARAGTWTVARCEAELTAAEARCAKDAHSADEFERCVQ